MFATAHSSHFNGNFWFTSASFNIFPVTFAQDDKGHNEKGLANLSVFVKANTGKLKQYSGDGRSLLSK